MYLTESCNVRSGESPMDAQAVARSREVRGAFEDTVAGDYAAMERLVNREPGDFAGNDAGGGNYYELTKSWPEILPERTPARHLPWPEGWRTVCLTAPKSEEPDSALRPLYSEPFGPAWITAPPAAAQQCPLYEYRRPYPQRAGKPASMETNTNGGAAGLLAAAVALLALGALG